MGIVCGRVTNYKDTLVNDPLAVKLFHELMHPPPYLRRCYLHLRQHKILILLLNKLKLNDTAAAEVVIDEIFSPPSHQST